MCAKLCHHEALLDGLGVGKATTVTTHERSLMLGRRFELVQEYTALHVERTDVDAQLDLLRSRWSQLRAGTVGPLPYDELRAMARELEELSECLRVLALRAQGILLEQQMLIQHLTATARESD
jgi:hypothetical protein